MVDNTLALQVKPTQFGENFQQGFNNGINQQMARQQQEAALFEQYATLGLGIMDGNPDGEIDPAKLEEALGMMGDNPIAQRIRQNPELLRTITKGSMNVLQFVRDGEKFELAKKQLEADLAAAQAPKPPMEVSPGATLYDTGTNKPIFTAPTTAESKPPDIVTIYDEKTGQERKGYMGPVDEAHPDGFYPIGGTKAAEAPDTFANEKDLFQQYSNSDPVKTYETVKSAYERVRESAAQESGAGDLALIYGFMRMLDPGSVVRESEFAMAAQAGDFGEQVQGAMTKVLNGERLPDTQRKEFLAAAEAIYAETAGNLSTINAQFSERAKGGQVDPTRFIREPEAYEPLGGDSGSGDEERTTPNGISYGIGG